MVSQKTVRPTRRAIDAVAAEGMGGTEATDGVVADLDRGRMDHGRGARPGGAWG
jgi:hypothetical protein